MRTLCLDFDGVIHSYASGWQGAKVISDPPVPGALRFICEATDGHFNVAISSARSGQRGGIRAMRRWLYRQYWEISGVDPNDMWKIPDPDIDIPKWWFKFITRFAFADPWKEEVRFALDQLMKRINFPKRKPAAFVSIDDRAITFTGTFPEVQSLKAFQPWYRQDI